MESRFHPLFMVFLCEHNYFFLRITCIFLHFAVPLHREKGEIPFVRKKVLDTLK